MLEGTDPANDFTLRSECESACLATLYRNDLSAILGAPVGLRTPLLPDDDADVSERTVGLAHWSEGFLHGLVSGDDGENVKKRLGQEPLADIIKDMLQITRAGLDEEADNEDTEAAYAELVEYLRVAAQLGFEELAELRNAAAKGVQ